MTWPPRTVIRKSSGLRTLESALYRGGLGPVAGVDEVVARRLGQPPERRREALRRPRLQRALQQHPLGRLFDLDVLHTDGRSLSRREFDLPPRRCLICDDLAAVCGRSRRHSNEELQVRIRQILHTYLSIQEERHVCTV